MRAVRRYSLVGSRVHVAEAVGARRVVWRRADVEVLAAEPARGITDSRTDFRVGAVELVAEDETGRVEASGRGRHVDCAQVGAASNVGARKALGGGEFWQSAHGEDDDEVSALEAQHDGEICEAAAVASVPSECGRRHTNNGESKRVRTCARMDLTACPARCK